MSSASKLAEYRQIPMTPTMCILLQTVVMPERPQAAVRRAVTVQVAVPRAATEAVATEILTVAVCITMNMEDACVLPHYVDGKSVMTARCLTAV